MSTDHYCSASETRSEQATPDWTSPPAQSVDNGNGIDATMHDHGHDHDESPHDLSLRIKDESTASTPVFGQRLSTSSVDSESAWPLSTSPSTSGSQSGSGSGSASSYFSTPVTPQLQSPLLRSPSEILHKVLSASGGEEVLSLASVAKTCRELRSFIYENPDQALWRDIHLSRFDDPRAAGCFSATRNASSFDWKKRVQERELVGRIIKDWDESKYAEVPEHIDLICATLLDMYLDLPAIEHNPEAGPSASDQSSATTSTNSSLLNAYLRSPLFTYMYINLSLSEVKSSLRPLTNQPGNPNRRTSRTVINPTLSRLHCLLPPAFDKDDVSHKLFRGYLREVVYTGANFQERNDYGPFHPDGTVDWTLVDAISSVMMANAQSVLRADDEGWQPALEPMAHGIDAARGWGYGALKRPDSLPDDQVWDWAGVEGAWCGSYAFLDYADWVSLNEPRLILLRRTMNQLDLSRYDEAIGDLMRLDLVIDRPGDSKSNPNLCPRHQHHNTGPLPPVETNLATSDLLPPIHFHGSSVQHHGNITYPSQTPISHVRGVVRMTADDPPQVRWTLVIRYGGEDRWRLECVQVGGRGSKRGFFGIWTDAQKEEHSPNGPVWYWKA